MSNAVKNETSTPAKVQGGVSTDIIVIGAIVLGLAALIAYQLLGCATCYGASWL
jgi:hypothetical protein